jgi:hypothetical protein
MSAVAFFAILILAAWFAGAVVDYGLYRRHLRWLRDRALALEEDFDY